MVSRLLEVSVTDADEDIRTRFRLTISLALLKDHFFVLKKGEEKPYGKRAPDVYPSPDCLVRAYLLYLLGATFFPISLAFMYRQLGIASSAKVMQISGYLTLLAGWMYDRLPFLEPVLHSDYTSEKPRVTKYHHKKEDRVYKKETRLLLDHLVSFRRRLDMLRSHEGAPIVHDIAFYHGPKKFMDIVEPHNPIRVLRQMGYVQRIPRDPTDQLTLIGVG
ncbi:hypothetical protein Scep_002243 [Stephania cephalantha]|uniref:Aminotransferase-like plant mobile domain-containing protein n=1 Tax=Stephania cephalantha TaxID=152367 RepID=A0AAP0L9K5_9MAGN